jgi:hypothetical protein
MSFDIRIVNGDIAIDEIGQLALVRNIDKVAQDVLRIIMTSKGSDPFDTSYGISTTDRAIGAMPTTAIISTALEAEITTSLQKLVREQNRLSIVQTLTADERIREIDSVVVEQDPIEPRQLNVSISMTLETLEPITIQTHLQSS